MKKLFKIAAGLLITLIILFIAAAVLITNFVDPNSFKPTIEEKVKASTGKTLKIDGQLAWSFFPTLGISTGKLALENPPGFAGKHLLLVDAAKLSVKVLPLIVGNIELGDISLKGLDVKLIKKSDGQTNWAMPNSTPDEKSSTASSSDTSKSFTLKNIPDIDIDDVNLFWNDQQTGTALALTKLSLQLKKPSLSSAFPVSMAFDIKAQKPDLQGHVAFDSKVAVDIDKQYYQANDLALIATLTGDYFSGHEVKLQTAGELIVDTPNQIIQLNKGKISLNELVAKADFYINRYKDIFHGDFILQAFNLKKLFDEIGIALPQLQSNKALTNIAGEISVKGTKNSAAFSKLEVTLDESILKGNINLTNIEKNAGTFAIVLNQINLDNYMPISTEQASDKKMVAANNTPANEKMTFKADMKGTADIRQVIVQHLKMQDLHASIFAKDNYLQLEPVSAKLYDGSINAKVIVDSTLSVPHYIANFDMSKVNVKNLVKDTKQSSIIRLFLNKVSGIADISTQTTTEGLTPMDIKRNLNGHGHITMKDGEVKGIDLLYFWKLAQAFISSGGHDTTDNTKQSATNETQFGSLSASYTITNGVVKNDDLVMLTSSFRATGKGTADIPGNTIDYQIFMASSGSAETDKPLPIIKISGKLDNPNVSLDIASLIKSITTGGVENIGKTIKENVGGLIKGLGF